MAFEKRSQAEWDMINKMFPVGGSSSANSTDKVKREYDPKTYIKKSGAGHKMAMIKTGKRKGQIEPITWGWRASKMLGITKYTCTTTKYTREVTSGDDPRAKRITWLTGIAVSIVNVKLGTSGFAWGLMEASTGRVIIKELSTVINPKSLYGGVVATIGAKKK